jgi:hypothetical protein
MNAAFPSLSAPASSGSRLLAHENARLVRQVRLDVEISYFFGEIRMKTNTYPDKIIKVILIYSNYED